MLTLPGVSAIHNLHIGSLDGQEHVMTLHEISEQKEN